MSTEQKDLEENALASRLTRTWDRFKQGKLISYRMMALLIIAITAIGLTWYILRERAREASKVWIELESATTITSLEEYSSGHPNTKAGKVAKLHIARTWLGPEGIDSLGARDPKAQQSAIENIEKAQKLFEELAKEFKDDPIVKAECYLGCAKAEEALIGIPQKDKPQSAGGGPLRPEDSRGSREKLIEWLDKLVEAAPETPWGQDAKKLASSLRETPSKVGDEIRNVQSALAKPSPVPSLPPLPPTPPGATPPAPSVPGVPGFTPEKPGTTTPNAGTPTPGPMAPAGTPPTTPGKPPDPKAPTGGPPMPAPAAPGTTTPMPMTPGTTPPAPTPPGPQPPEKKDTTPPTNPTPPAPKPPEKQEPPKSPAPMTPPAPPKK
jgi:hypothetical protein